MKPPIRLSIAFALIASLLGASGCSWFGHGTGIAPTEFVQAHDPKRLTDPATMTGEYRGLFPERGLLRVAGAKLTVQRRWLGVGKPFSQAFSYAGAESGNVRLKISNANLAQTFVDVAVSSSTMTVILLAEENKRVAFQGSLQSGGSPFSSVLGVEPGDLRRVFTIGERVWRERWTADMHWRSVELLPKAGGAQTDGLERIDLDRATGLPASARWRRGKDGWTVRYAEWGLYGDPKGARLMPRRVRIEPDRPAVTITLEMAGAESFPEAPATPELFAPRLAGAERVPLDRLEGALQELLEQ